MKKLVLLLLVTFFGDLNAKKWINPTGKKVRTIFYQGMNCSQTQGSKYTGDHGFISPTTGEHIVCDKSIDIIQDIWVKPEIDEVLPAPVSRDWYTLLFKPRSLLANVWQYSHEYFSGRSNYLNGMRVKQMSSCSAALTLAAHSLIVSKINIAQEGDLANHAKRVESFCQECPDEDAVFMGVSRGAATTFQAATRYNKESHQILDRTRLILLEGCFDDVEHTMKARHPRALKYEAVLNAFERIARKVIAFRKEGPSPLKAVKDCPKQIPIAFITSAIDTQVSPHCTKKLIKELFAAGHENIYLLELKNSSHSGYMMDDEIDKRNYQNFSHALFKYLNLPYIPEYADAGKDLVEAAKKHAKSLQ